MNNIKISRANCPIAQFNEGLSVTPVLVGEYDACKINRCTLKSGSKWTPDLYSLEENCQFFIFLEGKGYIGGKSRAWNIKEAAVFVPNFEKESFFIYAATDLTFVHIVAKTTDYDKTEIKASSLSLPRFRSISECWTYEEDFKGPGTTSCMLIEHRNLGRFSMGATLGMGPVYNGQHIHNELLQWYIALPNSNFLYTAGDETIEVNGKDITFTPCGFMHGSKAPAGQPLDYIWFEICENGYPGSIA